MVEQQERGGARAVVRRKAEELEDQDAPLVAARDRHPAHRGASAHRLRILLEHAEVELTWTSRGAPVDLRGEEVEDLGATRRPVLRRGDPSTIREAKGIGESERLLG